MEKLYCYVKEGEVVLGAQTLPINFENVSNFYLLDEEIIRTYGWLPYERNSENKEIFVSSAYEILEDKVIEHYITRDKTEQEKDHDAQNQKQNEWSEIRNKRDNLIKKTDVYVVSDRWEMMDSETKQSWSSYRQQLRDIPQTYSDPSLVDFPSPPIPNLLNTDY